MKKRHIFISILLALGIGAGAVTYAISPTGHEGKIGEAPELGRPGKYQIGTTVRDYVMPGRFTLTT